MHKELAERVSRELLACSGKLDRSIATIDGAVDQELAHQCRRLVGQIMGVLYIEILREIFAQYPDLEPESMK